MDYMDKFAISSIINIYTKLAQNIEFHKLAENTPKGTSMASPTTSWENPDDASQNNAMAVLAYILFFIPLLTGDFKTSPFVKFHTNQGTVMFIVALAYGVVCGILSTILLFIPFIGWMMILLLGMVWLIYPVFMVMGIINVTNGQMKPLPLIGDITIIR